MTAKRKPAKSKLQQEIEAVIENHMMHSSPFYVCEKCLVLRGIRRVFAKRRRANAR